jgi:hypothetical protein
MVLQYTPIIYTHLVYQYSETNVVHFLFSLLRIKGLNMFRALLAHLQEVLHKRQLVYWVRVMSFGCSQLTEHARHVPSVVCAAPPEDELETCKSNPIIALMFPGG